MEIIGFVVGVTVGWAIGRVISNKPTPKQKNPWNVVQANKSVDPPAPKYTGPLYGYFQYNHVPPQDLFYTAGTFERVSVCPTCFTISHHHTSGWPGVCSECGCPHLADNRVSAKWDSLIRKWIMSDKCDLRGIFPKESDTLPKR